MSTPPTTGTAAMDDLEQICSTVEFSGPQPTEPPPSELALVFSSSDAAAFAGVHDHNLAGFGKLQWPPPAHGDANSIRGLRHKSESTLVSPSNRGENTTPIGHHVLTDVQALVARTTLAWVARRFRCAHSARPYHLPTPAKMRDKSS